MKDLEKVREKIYELFILLDEEISEEEIDNILEG